MLKKFCGKMDWFGADKYLDGQMEKSDLNASIIIKYFIRRLIPAIVTGYVIGYTLNRITEWFK